MSQPQPPAWAVLAFANNIVVITAIAPTVRFANQETFMPSLLVQPEM
jgi:hypothetical protein